MTYRSNYDPERFYLLDHNWDFLSVRDGEMIARVANVNILTGEHRGQILDSAIITFRGFHMTVGSIIRDGGTDPISLEQMAELLTRHPYFVFSFWADSHECEFAALAGEAVAMEFTYDSAQVTWETL